jgi:DNA-binding response OmpR family regulator
MLPGTDGYALCRLLRDRPGMTTARIIMVSAKAMPEDRAAGFSAGADAYLTKPFEEDDLLALVRNVAEPFRSNSPIASSSES